MVDRRGTLTADELAVVEFLRAGPALLGAETAAYTVHRRPTLYDTANGVVAAARLDDSVHDPTAATRDVRTVDRRLTKGLAARGLVTVEHGLVTLTADHPDLEAPG